MAKNFVFKEADYLSAPVPNGTKAGVALRIGALNAVTVTAEGGASETISLGAGVTLTQPAGAASGNKPGFASVALKGSANLPVSGVTSFGTPVYIVSGSLISAPSITLGATATTGGTFAAGTYYWKVTAINVAGETIGSNEATQAIAANGTQVLNWSAISGATGYKVYRGTAPGAQSTLVATLGTVVTYTDTGIAGTAGTVPTVNSTGDSLLRVTGGAGAKHFGVALAAKTAPVADVHVKIINNGFAADAA
ncbi:hypothetical protein [uncultured Arthrobacter sp.]|uniref:hypothetical protein n=1 Tax=uncultured Arthrobacter sp. TaxID=114050 RepID=UPI0032168BCA